MKITPLFTVVLTNTCVVVVAAAAVAQTADMYHCTVNGKYETFDDPIEPLLPTGSEEIWATTKIMSSYNAVHGTDFEMEDIIFENFTFQESRHDAGNKVVIGASALRGANKNGRFGAWKKWQMRVRGKGSVSCRNCGEWDDDAAAAAAVLKVTVDIDATLIHLRWEQAWCDELQQSGQLVFEYATNCKIDLFNCVLSPSNPDADGDGNASEIQPKFPALSP